MPPPAGSATTAGDGGEGAGAGEGVEGGAGAGATTASSDQQQPVDDAAVAAPLLIVSNPLADEAALLGYVRLQFTHYFGPAAQAWPLAAWAVWRGRERLSSTRYQLPLVLVLQSGGALEVDWASASPAVPAVLHAPYLGLFAGAGWTVLSTANATGDQRYVRSSTPSLWHRQGQVGWPALFAGLRLGLRG